jgi:hypothetical protein
MKRIIFAFFLFLTFSLNTIHSQELTMFGGLGWEYYQDDKKIDKRYFKQLLSDVPAAQESWKKANLNQGIGIGMLGVQIGFGLWMIDNDEKRKSIAVPAVGFAASALSALVFSIRSMTHRKHAILNYNRSFDKNKVGQRLSPSSSGLGLAWSF